MADLIQEVNHFFTPSALLGQYRRRPTVAVNVGGLYIGSDYPIRLQSMTTTDTMDTEATVAESLRMIEAGCELVRITAPSINEAANLENIRARIRAAGYDTPLVADIHFTPNAAEVAARIVEKVRINPGNYVDKKKFEVKEYTDSAYQAELDRIRQRFTPLLKICKEYGTAMRIGTNHGSLSDRIMNRYGDTPEGMVESAMEFLRICAGENYHNIVLSMKSSNPQVMIQAYRLLIKQMEAEGMAYPLHLGVTEAGEADEGRIKSAMGIGSLLTDGIGDTIRVSLTEPPEMEIPVARLLAARYEAQPEGRIEGVPERVAAVWSPYSYARRKTLQVNNMGGAEVPRIIADLSHLNHITPYSLRAVGYAYDAVADKWTTGEMAADYLFFGNRDIHFEIPSTAYALYYYTQWQRLPAAGNIIPVLSLPELMSAEDLRLHPALNILRLEASQAYKAAEWPDKLKNTAAPFAIMLYSNAARPMNALRLAILHISAAECRLPVIIEGDYSRSEDWESILLESATDAGGLLCDGLGDALFLRVNHNGLQREAQNEQLKKVNELAFYILQASRTRISKTEFISCPSCGRTLFNLLQTTALVRARLDHLKGVKIAIMGCIVNGPGEMADADYGYVGTGPGKITLYRGKEVVKKNIESERALDELIEIIAADGRWIDRES